MNASEYIDSLNKPIPELDGKTTIEFYGVRHDALFRLYTDSLEAIEEGYLEGLDASQYSEYNYAVHRFTVTFPDGKVMMDNTDRGIVATFFPKPKKVNPFKVAHKAMTPYERTRAMVYATGNRWAIENFEATH